MRTLVHVLTVGLCWAPQLPVQSGSCLSGGLQPGKFCFEVQTTQGAASCQHAPPEFCVTPGVSRERPVRCAPPRVHEGFAHSGRWTPDKPRVGKVGSRLKKRARGIKLASQTPPFNVPDLEAVTNRETILTLP